MRKALVTGIAGFAGSHLSELLLKEHIEVFGFYHPSHSTENINHIKDKLNLIACDVLVKKTVEESTKKIKPDLVFHLSAFSSPPQSFLNPQATLNNNIEGQLNLLESLAKINSNAKILIIGSSEEYGDIPKKYLPANEDTPFAPTSPYAVSKIAQDMLGLQFFLHNKLKIVRVRPFNHIGPRQAPMFVVPSFASQVAQLEKQGGGILKVGNVETYRDFTDVRDMVKAYLLALDMGKFGEVYNIGSARSIKIKEVLEKLLSFTKAKIKIQVEKSRLRTKDTQEVICNFTKFKKQTGWEPKIPIDTTLFDTIEYERSRA